MSVNLDSRRNVGILVALIAAVVVFGLGGLMWYDGPLIEEVLLLTVVVLAGLILYDRLLVM